MLRFDPLMRAVISGTVPEGTPVPSLARWEELRKLGDRLIARAKFADTVYQDRAERVLNHILNRLIARDFPRN